MPDRKRVEAFIEAVTSNDHVQAIADFYHEDATMQENGLPPRTGRAALMEHEAAALARLTSMETAPVSMFLVDGDNVAIRWVFFATAKDGVRRRLEELALQRWRGDRIAEERFFYDTATAWQPVEGN